MPWPSEQPFWVRSASNPWHPHKGAEGSRHNHTPTTWQARLRRLRIVCITNLPRSPYHHVRPHHAAQARTYLVFGGAIYLVLFVYGLIVGQESAANFVPVNTADDFLHLILGIGMVGLGFALTRDRRGIAGATS